MLPDCHTYRFLLLPALLASLLLCSCRCSDSCGDTPAPQTDSIVHVVTGYLVNEDLKGAMAVIDSGEAAGMLRAYNAEMLRLRVMSRDESRMAEAEQRYLSLLETDLSQPQMQTVLERLSYIARQRNDDRAQLDYGSRYIDVCLAKGQKALSASYWQRYASLLKQINNAERLAAAQESAARYHEREQQAALEAERAKHRRDVGIAWILAAVVLIIVAFTVVLVYQLQQISRKNAVLSREIAENIGYKEKYLRLKSQPEIDAQQKDKESIPRLSTMNDAELFEFLHVVIVGEQLFLNPLFERQQLIDRFGLSKDSIGSAFAHGSRFASLPGYINECRLDYGARLLSVRPELSVAEVTAASGFASASVFTRNFRQRFTMTPTEFRERQSKAHNAE